MWDIQVLSFNEEQIRDVYGRFLVRDFPQDEVKPLSMILKARREGKYVCFGAYDREELLAYAFFVILPREGKSVYLFDYLAVLPQNRGKGVGSAFLQALMAHPLQDAECVLLEIDHPDFGLTVEEREKRLRRQHFYLKNGLLDTRVQANVYGVEFKILELPIGPGHPRDWVRDMYSKLYAAILPPAVFDARVKVRP